VRIKKPKGSRRKTDHSDSFLLKRRIRHIKVLVRILWTYQRTYCRLEGEQKTQLVLTIRWNSRLKLHFFQNFLQVKQIYRWSDYQYPSVHWALQDIGRKKSYQKFRYFGVVLINSKRFGQRRLNSAKTPVWEKYCPWALQDFKTFGFRTSKEEP